MNKYSLYIATALMSVAALSACDDDWTRPPMDVPTLPENFKANTTLAELKTAYWQDQDSYGTKIGLNADGDSIVISGTVVSSDQSGNIYKSIVLQDATGAITIGINSADLYEEYPQGIGLAINVTGLTIGRYSGLMQLGTSDGTGVNRIELADFQPHAAVDYYAGHCDTTTVTLDELNEANKSTEGKIQWQSRLIRIDNIKFKEAGEPFTNGSTTSRYIIDDEGNEMIVYNSSYSDFAYDNLPYGHGSVVGILSCYRTSWQLLLIDANSCIDFDGEGAPDPNLTTLLNEPFGANSQGDFTIEDISMGEGLTYVWKATEKYGMNASAFANSTSYPSDSWLISPEIDLNGYHTPTLQFSHCCNKFASLESAKQQVSVAVREIGGEWQPVTIPNFSTNADWTFVESGALDLSAFAGKKIQFGFHYTSSTESAGTWEIKNVKLQAIKIVNE